MKRIKTLRMMSLLGLTVIVAACSTTRHVAPVSDRTPGPAFEAAQTTPDGNGFYTVKRGDTLFRIAQDNGQTVRDLVAWNNLTSPDDLRVDQVLRVQPPQSTMLAGEPSAAQTGSIVDSGVEVRPLNAPSPDGATTHKNAPSGDKRPYSTATMEEMRTGAAGSTSAPPTQVAKIDPNRTTAKPAAKPIERLPEPPPAGTENIEWIWPTDGRIVATFSGSKMGIDIAGKMGQPVMAASSGTVVYASSVRGYGNLVIVKHTNNLLTAYAHNNTILVKEGQAVSKGQKIAEMGKSDSESVKLHFEIRQQGKPVDPTRFLPPR